MNYIIKELVLNEDREESGIHAVSLVTDPAIMENFVYFNKDVKIDLAQTDAGVPVRDFYEYTAQPEPEIIENSHQFCREKAGNVYHISEINAWGRMGSQTKKSYGFNTDSKFFSNFNGNVGSFNVNRQIYNCRHWLRRVNSVNEIPAYKRTMNFKNQNNLRDDLKIEFKVSNKEKREIEGLVLQSGQFIYRKDINGKEGYVYCSRETIRKLKEKYGFNRTITIQHEEDMTGSAILLDSWLNEDDEQTKWFLRFKIINDKLWELIKVGDLRGFSIEAIFDFN